ncbi:palmitoyltransferase [Fusarium solani]
MKLFYIGIVRNQDKPAVELVSEKELSAYSRFTKNRQASRDSGRYFTDSLVSVAFNSYGELMTLFSKTVAERTRPGQRLDVEEHDLVSHAFGSSEGICGM